jgi:hypothetical protein
VVERGQAWIHLLEGYVKINIDAIIGKNRSSCTRSYSEEKDMAIPGNIIGSRDTGDLGLQGSPSPGE